MADYISKYTGGEIDAAIGKATDINKNAIEVNSALSSVDRINIGLTSAEVGEVLAKKADGSLEGTGIINEDDKIFFPKDGRFPSASVDIGPAITISENGGWTQYHTNTLNKDYIFVDYEINKNGSTRPVYWERLAEEKNVVLHVDDTQDITINTFDHIPTTNSQVNAMYFNFTNPVTNFIAEIISLDTNLPIKYIPSEVAWKTGTGGLNLQNGIQDVLMGKLPFSALTSYHLRFNLKTPVIVKGNGIVPYLAVDRQKINNKGIMLQGEGTGSPDTAEQVRDKLGTLIGNDRLDASHIKNLPSVGIETAESIRDKLQTLQGNNRLKATSIQGIHEVLQNIDGGSANSAFDSILNGGDANGN